MGGKTGKKQEPHCAEQCTAGGKQFWVQAPQPPRNHLMVNILQLFLTRNETGGKLFRRRRQSEEHLFQPPDKAHFIA